jgi:hypothetical protein
LFVSYKFKRKHNKTPIYEKIRKKILCESFRNLEKSYTKLPNVKINTN